MQLTIETLSFSDVVNYQRNGRIPDVRRQKTGESLLTSCIPHLNLYRTILCEIKIEMVFVYKIFLHENLKKRSEIIGQQFATRMQMHQNFHVFKFSILLSIATSSPVCGLFIYGTTAALYYVSVKHDFSHVCQLGSI